MFVGPARPDADALWTQILCSVYPASTKVSVYSLMRPVQSFLVRVCVYVCCHVTSTQLITRQCIHTRLVFNSLFNCLCIVAPSTAAAGRIRLQCNIHLLVKVV